MKREFSWAERREKGRKNSPMNAPTRKGGKSYADGTNVYGKRCECDRPTIIDAECWKCGREPKHLGLS